MQFFKSTILLALAFASYGAATAIPEPKEACAAPGEACAAPFITCCGGGRCDFFVGMVSIFSQGVLGWDS